MTPLPKGRATFCLVDLKAIRWNFRQARKKVGRRIKILSVVKANAYGHGAQEVARTLEREGSDSFGTATVEEGIDLRKGGIRSPILVLAGVYPDQLGEIQKYHLTPVISELATMHRLDELAQRRGTRLLFHLKVDTGMGRIGFLPSETDDWLPELAKLKRLKLEGLLSHFSQAESVLQDYTLRQLESFRTILERLRSEGQDPSLVHLANSAAVLTMPPAHFNMVRPGLMLYGNYPSQPMAKETLLKPALTWKTRVQQLKRVPKGSCISYGQTFTTQRESLIATLPVGYADGLKRVLSNRGAVLVRGQRAPVIGTVCMDLTTVDVTDIAGVRQGDEVVLLGKQKGEVISAEEMAGWANTISYEILTSISVRVPRFHKN